MLTIGILGDKSKAIMARLGIQRWPVTAFEVVSHINAPLRISVTRHVDYGRMWGHRRLRTITSEYQLTHCSCPDSQLNHDIMRIVGIGTDRAVLSYRLSVSLYELPILDVREYV